MKHFIYFFFVLFTFNAHGQMLTVKQAREDFDHLRRALEEAHGGLYRHHSKPEMDRLFDQYRPKLKQPVNQLNYYGFLSSLLARIGDGHMKLEYAGITPNPYVFPFRILTEDKKATILSNDTRTDTIIKPGMRLLSVNNRPFKTIRRLILPYLIGDGHIQTGKTSSLQRNFSQLYKVFVDTSSVFVVKVQDPSGKKRVVKVTGVKVAEREANYYQNPVNAKTIALTAPLEGSKENASVRFINDSIASLRIRYFIGDRFREEIDSLFALISKEQSKFLILDIRGNGGGLDEYGAYTAAKFATKPFRYIDRVHARILIPSDADWKAKPPVDLVNGTEPDPAGGYLLKRVLNSAIGLQAPAEHPYAGKLVILVDGKTFSAASDFAAIISNISKATLVGIETGGGYEGNTSALNEIVKLPNSKFKVNIHLWDYWSAVRPPKLKGRGVIPDYTVERNAADWLNGVDTQWEFAVKLCRND